MTGVDLIGWSLAVSASLVVLAPGAGFLALAVRSAWRAAGRS